MACLTHMVLTQIVRQGAGDVEGRKRCLESKAEGISNSLKPQSLKSLKHIGLGLKTMGLGLQMVSSGSGVLAGGTSVQRPCD